MLLHYLRHLHHLPPTRSSEERKGLDDGSLSQRRNGVDGQIHEEACWACLKTLQLISIAKRLEGMAL